MTVGELIHALALHPADLPVKIVDNYYDERTIDNVFKWDDDPEDEWVADCVLIRINGYFDR